MVSCALCPAEISDANKSREHIIPQSIGGRKQTHYFICKKCNNTAGSGCDAELAKQLNWFSVGLNIKRESGKPSPSHPVKTLSGQKLLMHASGSLSPADPIFKKEEMEDGKSRVQFMARTWSEARDFLSGIKKKYPGVDYAPIENALRMVSKPLDEPLHVTFDVGGPLTGRSIVKSALAMASELDIPMVHCSSAIKYLREAGADVPWAAFHLRDLVKNRPTEYLFHTAAITGDPVSGNLLGYVEYFCAFRFIVILSRAYQGPVVRGVYAVDPATGAEVDVEIELSLSEVEVEQVLSNDAYLFDALKTNVELALPIVLKAMNNNGRVQILDNIITTAFQDCGVEPDGELSPEQYAKFSALVAQRFAEVLVRRHYHP